MFRVLFEKLRIFPSIATLILCLMLFFFIKIHHQLKKIRTELTASKTSTYLTKKDLSLLRTDLISLSISEQVDKITGKLNTEEEKVKVIAEWIASHITNTKASHGDVYSWYASRTGLCAARAHIFVEMLKTINVPAKVFNIYNFPYFGAGHSCAQVFYNGKWHFYDVTYAGYFEKNNNVLSWDEIKEENAKGQLLEHMKVFANTVDRYGTLGQELYQRMKANNKERMLANYTKKAVLDAKSYGFYRDTPINLYVKEFDLKNRIALQADNYSDFEQKTTEKGVSQSLGIIGNLVDNFVYHFQFKNLVPGEEYFIKFKVTDKYNYTDDMFKVISTRATILSGKNYHGGKVWKISFIPEESESSVVISLKDFSVKKGIYINSLEVSSPKR